MGSRRARSRPEAGREQEKLSPYCRWLSEVTRKDMPFCQTPGHHVTLHPTPRCSFRTDGIWVRLVKVVWGCHFGKPHHRCCCPWKPHDCGCRAVTSVSVPFLLWQVAIPFRTLWAAVYWQRHGGVSRIPETNPSLADDLSFNEYPRTDT